jgi:hypothetical protein
MFRKATNPKVSACFPIPSLPSHLLISATDSTRDRIGCSWNAISQNTFICGGLVQRNGENPMKMLISTFAVALALAFSGPAFAGDVKAAKTEADCTKAGGTWNATTNMCEEKKM